MKKYYISICLLTKNENDYLHEWINYHINLGVEHFYIYDNESDISVEETLIDYIKNKVVTIVKWKSLGILTQIYAYNHCCKRYGMNNEWIAFIDTDEFIVLSEKYKNIRDVLKNYDKYGGVGLSWLMFGSSYLEKKPDSVLKSFYLSSEKEYEENKHIKSIVKPLLVNNFVTPHHASLKENIVVDEKFNDISNTPFNKPTHDDIYIHHYYTRSKEEFERKIERGRGDKAGRRSMTEFFEKEAILNKINHSNNLNKIHRFII